MRREVGGNGANQFQSNSELNSPKLKTTEDIAQEIGISKRTAQRVGAWLKMLGNARKIQE